MKSQVTSIVKNCHAQLRNIGKIRQYLSSDASTNLIHAFISSRLDYCNSLHFALQDTDIQRLQKVQNTAARILTLTRKYDHITPILQQLHWLTVKERIDFKVLMLTHKCLNGLAPAYLSELLEFHTPARPLRSGDQHNLKVPRTRLKTYGDRAFCHAAPVLWNNLPERIKLESSLDTFKSKLKTHFFSSRK